MVSCCDVRHLRHCLPYTEPRSPNFCANSSSVNICCLNFFICMSYVSLNAGSFKLRLPKSVISGPVSSSLYTHFLKVHSFHILLLFSSKYRIFVFPLINHNNSLATNRKGTLFVVKSGKPSLKSNRI